MADRRQIVVMGLGRFGFAVARTLMGERCEVLGIDRSPETVQEARDVLTHVVQAHVPNEQLIRDLGLNDFDIAVVAIGGDVEANILATAQLLEAGTRYVVARANSMLHGSILQRIGANRVVYPETHSGQILGQILRVPGIVDHINLGPAACISMLHPPDGWIGCTVDELQQRARMPLLVLAIQRGDETIGAPAGTERIQSGDVLAVLSEPDKLERLGRA